MGMLLEHQITTMTHRLACETAAIKVWLALRSLEAGHWEDEPRIPRGQFGGGRWTRDGAIAAVPAVAGDVIYVCTRVGSVPVRDEAGGLAYAVSYLCGFDNKLLSWTTTTRLRAIIPDPRF
jgi:hypothetical protein